tara:strand:- start:843 stop:1067 length:225 start_codon:yes stop_codon:yes gene_type:complete
MGDEIKKPISTVPLVNEDRPFVVWALHGDAPAVPKEIITPGKLEAKVSAGGTNKSKKDPPKDYGLSDDGIYSPI